jgi:hypothetical protein
MNFLEFDLGQLEGGETVRVALTGVESDVMLMTSHDLASFRAGRQFSYVGGHFQSSPALLSPPHADHWHAVVVPGLGGRVSAKVNVSRLTTAAGL